MKTTAIVLMLMIALPPFAHGRRATAVAGPQSSRPRLDDASPSAEALVQRFLEALDNKDGGALRRMRTTESEYKKIILPGTVPRGTALRHYPDDVSEYFWSILNTKSAYYEQYLLETAGGRGPSKVKSVSYKKGTKTYADYTAYKQLRLVVEDGAGKERDIFTGSIAEIDKRYKFISFIRD
jgi:hypothetical protein